VRATVRALVPSPPCACPPLPVLLYLTHHSTDSSELELQGPRRPCLPLPARRAARDSFLLPPPRRAVALSVHLIHCFCFKGCGSLAGGRTEELLLPTVSHCQTSSPFNTPIYIHITHTHTYTHTHIHIYIPLNTHKHVCVYLMVFIYVCVYTPSNLP
jgi:hypothetical protein